MVHLPLSGARGGNALLSSKPSLLEMLKVPWSLDCEQSWQVSHVDGSSACLSNGRHYAGRPATLVPIFFAKKKEASIHALLRISAPHALAQAIMGTDVGNDAFEGESSLEAL